MIAEEKDRALQIHFVSVPEFLATGTNYFSVTLDRRGEITFNYGATNRSDAIVGVTQGGGAADPGRIDISRSLAVRDRDHLRAVHVAARILRRVWWSRSLVPRDYVQKNRGQAVNRELGSGRES